MPPAPWASSTRRTNKLAKSVEKHINDEKEMIKTASRLLEKATDPRLKLILTAILDDENKHHRLLVSVKELIEKYETIDEDEFWRQIWSQEMQASRHYIAGPCREDR